MADFGDILSDEPRESFYLPPGIIMPYGGTATTPPTGWLFCNGEAHGTVTYPDLFSAIGVTYGGGGTAFNVPDLRRRMVLGFGTTASGTAIGATGGAFDHTHTGPSHTHNMSNHTHSMQNHSHGMSHNHAMDHVHYMGGRGVSGYTVGGPGNTRFVAAPNIPIRNPYTGTTALQPAASNPATFTNSFQVVAATVASNTDGASSATTGASSSSSTGPPSSASTGVPSNNNTGAAGTGATGSNNPPYMTLQYIIKT